MARKKTTKSKSETCPIALTLPQREMLAHEVLSVDMGPRAELHQHRIRVNLLYPTPAEIKAWKMASVGPGRWGFRDRELLGKVQVETVDVQFMEKDIQLIRDCYEKQFIRKAGKPTPEQSALKRLFFTEEELEELANKYDPE